MANECSVCHKQFSKHSNLRSHVKKFHPGLVNEIAPNKITNSAAVCNKCMKTFSKYSNLKQHVLKFHPDETDKLTSSKVYPYPCEICQKNFSDINHYKNHKKIHLGEENVDKRLRSLQCSLCDNRFNTKVLLDNHFEQDHAIQILTKTLNFSTVNDFKCWKNNLEEKTHSRFVKQSGSYTTLKSIKTVYVCQRSGFYVAKGSGKRHLKIQGSKKINGVCPAEMHVTEFKNGEHKVDFTETHIGHDNDLGHLNLTVAQRMEVAAKIATKIPFSCILDDIRDSVTNNKLERIHLLTKMDLHNVTQTFNLNNDSVRHKDDVISIESWIHEVNESGTVIYYKPQSKLCNRHPNLKEEDFMLIIMHPGQLDILQKFSNDCICIDGTHGLNSYNFELTTLLVLDDMREGFPCSFLFSNRSDEDIMRIFFYGNQGENWATNYPKCFYDMAQYYYTAWLQEMLPAKVRLFCTWHVDRAWRKNLGKIVGQDQKKNVYRQLRTLLQERDVVAFSNMLTNFVSLMQSSSKTLEFANYFRQYYLNNVNSWAYCYRLGAGLNTNMHIERMHHTIKYIYLNGKHVKRLDKTINTLMKLVKDKLFERVITMNKGKISSKLKELRKRHKSSEELDISSIVESEMGWQFPSASTSEIYLVEERNLNCSCKLVCSFCAACLHSYSCTCLDNSIRWNMCKHIHLVCHYRKSITEYPIPKSPEDHGEIRPLVIDDSKDEFIEENERLAQILSKPSTSISHKTEEQLIAEKEKLKILHIGLIEKMSSFEELETFKKITAPLVPTLSAVKNSKTENKFHPAIKNLPHNKLICKQQRLFSTKKKAGKQNKKLAKPTSKEADTTAIQLLNVNV